MKKHIYIHVGPPKTGSSAIQKWFNENTQLIESFGIFYPQHKSDVNGISSGNLNTVCDKDSSGNYVLSKEKISSLLSEFESSQFECLFLSSEFFFKLMDDLKQFFPNANFVAYLRDPMAKRESSYNQGVKRHSTTLPFPSDLGKKGITDLITLQKFIDGNDRNAINIRLYGERYFKNKNIISDILDALGIDHDVESDTVNPSYQFEALEFKRWLNNYPIENSRTLLDNALQAYSRGTTKFSLIQPSMRSLQRKHDHKLLDDFLRDKNIERSDEFLVHLSEKHSAGYKRQELSEAEFTSICSYVVAALGKSIYHLREVVENETIITNPMYKRIFLDIAPKSYIAKAISKMTSLKSLTSRSFSNKPSPEAPNKKISGLAKLRAQLKIPDSVEDADILRLLAVFSEDNGNIEFALLLIENSAIRRKNGPLIQQQLLEYREKYLSKINNNR